MPDSFSYAVSMNLEHSIKEGSHERYPDHLQCFRNIKKIKYPDFQAMTTLLRDQLKPLSYTTAQCNPTVERGPDRKLKIKPLPKEKAEDKTTQTQEKDKST